MKKTVYVDMDGVIASFNGAINDINQHIDVNDFEKSERTVDAIVKANPRIFETLKPIDGAIEAVTKLFPIFDVYFLSTPMWDIPESFMGKRIWIERQFGEAAKKRLILTHRKDLNIGDFLIDDRTRNGAGEFKGELILFGSDKFPEWNSVLEYLIPMAQTSDDKEMKKGGTIPSVKPKAMTNNIKELIAQVKQGAIKELEYCNQVDTPYVCGFISDAKGKEMIVKLIVEYVGKNGMTISEAINHIERNNNPKLAND